MHRREAARQGIRLTIDEQGDIFRGLDAGESYAQICAEVICTERTIWRVRHRCVKPPRRVPIRSDYRAYLAEKSSVHRNLRTRAGKLQTNLALRTQVEQWLYKHFSPQQIAARLSNFLKRYGAH